MGKLKYIIFILPLLLTSCVSSGGGGGFDFNKILRNPVVMIIIVAIAVWAAFKMRGSKG